jgi:transposase, IS30 family
MARGQRKPVWFTEAEKSEIWNRIEAGEAVLKIAAGLGHFPSAIRRMQLQTGGVRPPVRHRSERALRPSEREEISRGLSAGRSIRSIAAAIDRSPSTVCREVNRNGGRVRYRAVSADRRALREARRPKVAKLARCHELRQVVEDKLELRWSPRQIAKWLSGHYPNDPEMRVSHETIYMSLFVQGRGALRKELHQALRTGRAIRRPKASLAVKGSLRDMVLISERPAEVDDRAVPGHWEGDLIMGTRKSCIGTLVERTTRFVMLLKLENNTSEAVREAMSRKVLTLPEQLRRSLTWDRGKEMAQHRQFTIETGVQVYFCDPKSPWQRGTNENTNGLLRQYFPKRTSLAGYTEEQLDEVARELNERPRQTLDWMTPSEKLAEVVASTG